MTVTATRASDLEQLVGDMLRDQDTLTAVERFSQHHATIESPLQERFYRSLLPVGSLAVGEQYAFEVDLDLCSGCKACVTACHSLNGLDEGETWRDVGLLIGGTTALPVLQHVTAACHHCLEPACMNVCPTRAYEKDLTTGIVKHLDDQCFGCQYCILACPYDVPKYNASRGIVRKCDMCSHRLKAGEAPACVQACPHEAIRITIVKQVEVAADCEANPFLPGAPDPQYTQPTTSYKTNRVFPRNMLPADYHSVHAEHAHLPLIVMLVLTQLSVGAFFVEEWLRSWRISGEFSVAIIPSTICSVVFGLVALAAATLHLGRPHLAFRAILGLRDSWLSREIVAFGMFAAAAAVYSIVVWKSSKSVEVARYESILRYGVLIFGAFAVFCSAMIYHVVRREFWTGPRTFLRFFGTSAWLGTATILSLNVLVAAGHPKLSGQLEKVVDPLAKSLIIIASLKLGYELSLFQHLLERQMTSLRRSALLMLGELRPVFLSRLVAGVSGGLLLPGYLISQSSVAARYEVFGIAVLILLLSLVGEFCERFLYFTAAVAPRMPGGLKT